MSRKTEFKGTAASRRRARRANLQSQEAISSDKLHRPTPSRVVLQCKRKPAMRAEVRCTGNSGHYHLFFF